MNKKVLTLCAGFLLAGSLTAVAQYCPTNGEVPYRTHIVNAAALDDGFSGVTQINENLWYQLKVQTNLKEGSAADNGVEGERFLHVANSIRIEQPSALNCPLRHYHISG